jgi:glycosyltransferase 2 family protein
MTTSASSWRATWGLVAKLAVSALLIAVLLSRIDMSGVRKTLAAASWPWLLLGLLVCMAIPPLGGLRWFLALRGIGHKAKLADTTMIFSTALMFGQVLPSVAGDGLRVWLASRQGYRLRASMQSVLIERISMVLVLLALALATSPLLAGITRDSRAIWISAALFAGGIFCCALVLSANWTPAFLMRLRAWRELADAGASARRVATSRWGVLLFIASLVGNLNFMLAACMIGHALHVRASAWEFLAIMPAVTLATTLPISFGGWGVREGALVLLLGKAGVSGAEALSLSLLFGLFGMLCGLPGLLAWASAWRARTAGTADADALVMPRLKD